MWSKDGTFEGRPCGGGGMHSVGGCGTGETDGVWSESVVGGMCCKLKSAVPKFTKFKILRTRFLLNQTEIDCKIIVSG